MQELLAQEKPRNDVPLLELAHRLAWQCGARVHAQYADSEEVRAHTTHQRSETAST